jgi:putative transposase
MFLQEEFKMSERRSCEAIDLHRSTLRYRASLNDDQNLIQKMREIANKHPSYGYRRIHFKMCLLGTPLNIKKFRRLYKQEKLILRRKRKPRRIIGQGPKLPLHHVKKTHDLWAMDFMHDTLMNGRRLRVLTIIDHHSRYSPGIFIKKSFRASDLCKILDHLFETEGKPNALITDNGTEFTAIEFKEWAKRNKVELFYIRPGRPVENGLCESFNGRVRDEFLNQSVFIDYEDAAEKIEEWRNYYNKERPHSALGYLTPLQFMKQCLRANGLD